jgi:hypothetical protein
MVRSHLAALVLEGVHSLCHSFSSVLAEFFQSFASVLAEFSFQLFSGEAVFAPGIPRNKPEQGSLDSGGVIRWLKGFWCKLLKRSVSCDNGWDDGTDLGTGSLQRAAL